MLFIIACRNLVVNRRKSFAALLSIIVAFMTLSLFEGYLHDVKEVYDGIFSKRQMLGDIIIERKNSPNPGKAGMTTDALSPDEQEWVAKQFDPNVVRAHNRFLNISGIAASGTSRAIFIGQAFDPDQGAILRSPEYLWNTFAGNPLDKEKDPYPLQLGRELAEVIGCVPTNPTPEAEIKCTDPIVQLQVNTESGQANAMDFKVTGLMSTGFGEMDARMAVLPLATAQMLFSTHRVSYITVGLKTRDQVASWIKTFNEAAARDKIEVSAEPWQQHTFGDLFRQSIGFLMVFRNLVISIILVVVSITTINTFVKIVNERMREIGTMRSIGFKPYHVIVMFCTEAMLLGITGSVIGLLASVAAAKLCNLSHFVYNAGIMSEGFVFRIELHVFDFMWITGLIIILTIVATFLPTWRATKVPIAVILAER
ncbi:MAG: ABC transporter permease [Chitinophagaceae bacterium]|nr:ABC transporter permease [Oligoflexus sp.]